MTDYEKDRQEFARRLFGKPVEPPAPSNPRLGNHVPSESSMARSPRASRHLPIVLAALSNGFEKLSKTSCP